MLSEPKQSDGPESCTGFVTFGWGVRDTRLRSMGTCSQALCDDISSLQRTGPSNTRTPWSRDGFQRAQRPPGCLQRLTSKRIGTRPAKAVEVVSIAAGVVEILVPNVR